MAEKLTMFDPVEGLTFVEAIAAFRAEAFASGVAGYIAHALGAVARVQVYDADRDRNAAIARTTLSLVQPGRVFGPENHERHNERAWHRADGETTSS